MFSWIKGLDIVLIAIKNKMVDIEMEFYLFLKILKIVFTFQNFKTQKE